MTKIRNWQYLVNLMVLVMAAGQQINCFGPNKHWMIFCLPLDIHAASLDFISHKPGVSLMLLGPLLAVQTLMACGLATIPSSRKLGIVSQLRFVFDWGWGCPCMGIWPWSSVKYLQGLLWTMPLEIQIALSGEKSDERTQRPLQCPKNMIKGNRFQYCRDNSLHIHRCMLGLREKLNFLSHSFSCSSHSFSPPPGTSGLHHP